MSSTLSNFLENTSGGGGGGDLFGMMEGSLSEQSLVELQHEVFRNFSSGRTPWQFDLLKMPLVRAVVIVVYVVVIVTGVLSNAVAIYVASSAKKPQTVTNIFVISLAASDLSLCVFSLPIQLHYQLTDCWVLGEILCRVVFSAFALPMYLSSVTILLIAVDRYWLIVYPLKDRISRRMAGALIAVNLTVSVTIALPVMHFTSLYIVNEPLLGVHKHLCIENWPSAGQRQAYSVFTFVVQFCLPLSVTTRLYYSIYSRLRRRIPSSSTHGSSRPGSHPNTFRAKKTNKILVAIVINFVVFWMPWNLFSLITELDHSIVTGPYFKLVDISLKCFSMGSACVNPLLYCWLNDNLRSDLGFIAIKLRIYTRTTTAAAAAAAAAGSAAGNGRWLDPPLFEVQPPSSGMLGPDQCLGRPIVDNVRTFSVSVEKFSCARPLL